MICFIWHISLYRKVHFSIERVFVHTFSKFLLVAKRIHTFYSHVCWYRIFHIVFWICCTGSLKAGGFMTNTGGPVTNTRGPMTNVGDPMTNSGGTVTNTGVLWPTQGGRGAVTNTAGPMTITEVPWLIQSHDQQRGPMTKQGVQWPAQGVTLKTQGVL